MQSTEGRDSLRVGAQDDRVAEMMLPSPRGSLVAVAVSIFVRCNPSIAPLSHVTSVGDGTLLDRCNPFVIECGSLVRRGCSTSDCFNPFIAAGTLVTFIGDGTCSERSSQFARSIAAAPSVRLLDFNRYNPFNCGYARPLRRRRHISERSNPFARSIAAAPSIRGCRLQTASIRLLLRWCPSHAAATPLLRIDVARLLYQPCRRPPSRISTPCPLSDVVARSRSLWAIIGPVPPPIAFPAADLERRVPVAPVLSFAGSLPRQNLELSTFMMARPLCPWAAATVGSQLSRCVG